VVCQKSGKGKRKYRHYITLPLDLVMYPSGSFSSEPGQNSHEECKAKGHRERKDLLTMNDTRIFAKGSSPPLQRAYWLPAIAKAMQKFGPSAPHCEFRELSSPEPGLLVIWASLLATPALFLYPGPVLLGGNAQ